MERFSLSNFLMPVGHEQFVKLTNEFKAAAEKAFGSEARLDITARTAPKIYTTYADEWIQSGINAMNAPHVLLETHTLSQITKDVWKTAKYVEVSMVPVDREKGPAYAFAHAEFKGTAPREATFYIQGHDVSGVKPAMTRQNRWSLVGDGFDGNGVCDGATPAFL